MAITRFFWPQISTGYRMGAPFPCVTLPSSPCILVGRADCTLLRGIVSMENFTVFKIFCWSYGSLHTITGTLVGCSIWVTLVSTRSLCPIRRYLILLNFWLVEPSRGLLPCPLLCFYVRSQLGVCLESPWSLAKQSGNITWSEDATFPDVKWTVKQPGGEVNTFT